MFTFLITTLLIHEVYYELMINLSVMMMVMTTS